MCFNIQIDMSYTKVFFLVETLELLIARTFEKARMKCIGTEIFIIYAVEE